MKRFILIATVWLFLAGAIGFFSFRYIFDAATEFTDPYSMSVANHQEWNAINDAIRKDAQDSAIAAGMILSLIATGYLAFRFADSGKKSRNMLSI